MDNLIELNRAEEAKKKTYDFVDDQRHAGNLPKISMKPFQIDK